MNGNQSKSGLVSLYAVLCALIPVAVAFLVYSGTLSSGFVYDDNEQVLRNPWITSAKYLPEIFLSDSFGFFKETFQKVSYRPVMFVVYLFEYSAFGLDPRGWHFINVLLHGTNGAMVFLVISRLIRPFDGGRAGYLAPLAGALVFVTLPVNAEVVSWVGCVPELAYTLLVLFAFLLYMRGQSRKSPVYFYVLPALLFFMALLSKETAIVFPVMVFLYDLAFDRAEPLFASARIKRYLPMAIAFAAYIGIRSYVIGSVARSGAIETGVSDYLYLINAFPLFIDYLRAIVLPVNDYPLQVFDPLLSAFEPRVLIPMVVLLAVIVAIVSLRRRLLMLHLLAVAVIVLPILPALYVPTFSRTPFADRYLYLSTFGLALIAAMAVNRAAAQKARAGLVAVVAVVVSVVVANSVWAGSRSQIWKDDPTLWAYSAKGSEKNYVAVHSLGYLAMKDGRTDEAIMLLERSKALNLESHFPDRTLLIMTQKALGAGYQKKGLLDNAINEYNDVLRFAPEDYFVSYNLGTIYLQQGFFDDAAALFSTALLLTDDARLRKDIYASLGAAYIGLGKRAEAFDAYSQALMLAPDDHGLSRAVDDLRQTR